MYFQRDGVIRSAVSEDGLSWSIESGIRIGKGDHGGLDDRVIGSPTTLLLKDGTYLRVYRTEKTGSSCKYSPNPFATFHFEKKGIIVDSRD